jgi:alkaline phosphatase
MSATRRSFLSSTGLAGGVLLGLPGVSLAAGRSSKPSFPRRPRKIIHLVSDGMSMGTLTCADYLSHLVRRRPLSWLDLQQRDGARSCLMNMRSLNSTVTDSAAAASSWGCGTRVANGSLNMLPDGRQLRTLCNLMGEEDWARGLVTTTEITHATPAGFASNVSDRGKGAEIAAQYLDRRIEVLLGGGRNHFDKEKRADKRDLLGEFEANGYSVFRTREQLESAALTTCWLGVFATGHLPYTVDWEHNSQLRAEVPTLAQMTQMALRRLGEEKRFLLQVEGGRVDHGAHSSDAAAALYDQIAFDEALEVCLEFQAQAPDTLIVVTTDHGNANPGLNGMGSSYRRSPDLFGNLLQIRESFDVMYGRLKKAAGPDALVEKEEEDVKRTYLVTSPELVRKVIAEGTGYELTTKKAEQFTRYLAGEAPPLYDLMDGVSALMGQLLGNYLGIGWTGSAHTADYVPLLAYGPGAEYFHGFIENTDVFGTYLDLAGIKFRNPQIPLIAEAGPSAAECEAWSFA